MGRRHPESNAEFTDAPTGVNGFFGPTRHGPAARDCVGRFDLSLSNAASPGDIARLAMATP
jgi:hypothetical protein